MRPVKAIERLKALGVRFFFSMAADGVSSALHRAHLSRISALGKTIMRRVLGDTVTIEFEELKLQGPIGSRQMLCRMKAGVYDPFDVELLKNTLVPGMTVLDIGANIGFYSLLSSRAVGETGSVYAFEPDPRNVDHLRANVRANNCTNIQIVNLAVADRPGTVTLHMAEAPTHSSLFTPMGGVPTTASIEVEAMTIDDALRGSSVDFIKIDIEGGEPAALQGMATTLRNNPGLKMIVEFQPPALEAAGYAPEEFIGLLRSLFEDVFVIDEANRVLLPLTEASLEPANLFCSRARARPS